MRYVLREDDNLIRTIELTLSADKLSLFGFLKENPTRVLKKNDDYKFVYFQPAHGDLTSFWYDGLRVKVRSEEKEVIGWEVVRDLPKSYASDDLLETLQELEVNRLTEDRQGQALALNGWILNLIINGIFTKEETALMVRLLFCNGYSYVQTLGLFAAVVRKKDLSAYFLNVLSRFYKGEGYE